MPVNTGAVDCEGVFHVDLDDITPVGDNCRAWILIVEHEHVAREAIWGQGRVRDLEVVL